MNNYNRLLFITTALMTGCVLIHSCGIKSTEMKQITPDVSVYFLTYKTAGVQGNPVSASGIVMVPSKGAGPFPMISCQHGTLFYRRVAPSYIDSCLEAQAWLSEAAAKGYIVVMADYIGLGKSGPILHPYFHAATEATAARDMIRAARHFCKEKGILYGDKLFLVGYSQGGHVTSALQRLVEAQHPAEFRITASAIMAAPYDLVMLFRHHIETPCSISSAVTSLMVKTFQDIYHLDTDYSAFFQHPYDSLAPALLDFNHREEYLIQQLNKPPAAYFQSKFLERFNAGTHPLNAVLDSNEVYHWGPKAPTLLVFSMADEVVPYQIEEKAYATMVALGAKVDTVNMGNIYNHADGFFPALQKAMEWFSGFNLPGKKNPGPQDRD